MYHMSSYAADIVGSGWKTFNPTVQVYRDAVSCLIGIVDAEWETISSFSGQLRNNHVEHLVHTTSKNNATYPEFDERFHKFPSYLRRNAITAAIGAVSSYRSNYANWEENGRAGNPPRLQRDTHQMPVFYNGNMFQETDTCYVVKLKLYFHNDWVWVPVRLKKTDVDYINKYCWGGKRSCPTLECRYGRYSLRFAFQEWVDLKETEVSERRICAVDLGLNTDAVCSVMTADGTVTARKFINFAVEKDHLWHVLNRIRKAQRKYGPRGARKFWAYARRLNDELAKKIAAAIVEFADAQNVHTIVFEYLDFQGKRGKGSKKQRLAMWKRNSIQDYVTCKAHRFGIHISRICAWNTSRLAFDGSGKVERGKQAGFRTNGLCKFQGGKVYNCDLNASYNIGARYFLRALLNPLPEKERSRIGAKVPGAVRRTRATLSTLRELHTVMQEAPGAAA